VRPAAGFLSVAIRLTDRSKRVVASGQVLNGTGEWQVMRLDAIHAAVSLEVAWAWTWRVCARFVEHPLSMAASLLTMFLILSWWRNQLADRCREFCGHDVEV
jgi:hypothetical protein